MELRPFADFADSFDDSTDKNFKNVFLLNGITPFLDKNILFSKKLMSNLPNFDKWEKKPYNTFGNRLKQTNIIVSKEEINDLNFRSDNFKKIHDGKHIVFTGCSNTWGTGLKKEEVWSYKTYEKISKEITCSGYFNLGILGSSASSQIINLFKYFNEYGNPDIVFVNFPDVLRFYAYHDKTKIFFDSFYQKESKEMLELITFQYYLMLEQYCKSNNIKLYSFSWINSEQKVPGGHLVFEVPLSSFDTYYQIDKNNTEKYIEQYKKNNPTQEFIDFARDDEHPGIGHHEYWSDFIYSIYKKDL
jgi:hypothetical protein